MMPVIVKQDVTVVPSAKTGKDVQAFEGSCEVDDHLLIAGTGKFMHYFLF